MGRRAVLVGLAAALALCAAPASHAVAPPTPWDGSNPFNCTIQDAGLGPTGPDPAADPYCVRFDKTHQNVTQLGVVDFLSKEPARTAAASPKCFYFQEDHWRGSLVQSNQKSAVYEFEGHYFFDKATGDGGAWVTGFTVAGQTFDPTSLPGFPPQYGQYFGPGTGGFITHDEVPVDPACVALAKRNPQLYAEHTPRCVPDTGKVSRRGLGPVRLGASEASVRAELGPPADVERGFLRYCVAGGGKLLVGQPGDRSGTLGSGGRARTVIVLSTARGFVVKGTRIHVGTRLRALRRKLRLRRLGRVGATRVFRARRDELFAIRHGRVAYVGVYSRRAIRRRRALRGYLRRAR